MGEIWHCIIKVFTYTESSPIIFTEVSFWVFFTLLMLGYSFVFRKPYLRTIYLLLFSFFFYYKSSGLFFVLLIFATICDYTTGILIPISSKKWVKKLLVGISVAINLGVLAYFKYAYFFTTSINSFLGTNFEVVNYLSLWTNQLFNAHFDTLTILLPVGISFYTFQTISYTVDIYREKLKPVRNILDFGFYVSFFPQLVAGPIVRAAEFIPQIYKKYSLSWQEFNHAYYLILNGLIKKMLISDFISINFVDRVFDSPSSYSGFENLMATYGYALQIYCDFSGYTDIAIGVALLLGFRLPINFNSPYKAVNITDFWRRWHISLSTWLRDYLYIPLGGNRKGKVISYLNLMITMLLGGLWHGANIRFVVWGGIHGLSLVIHKLWLSIFPTPKGKSSTWKRFLAGFVTFQVVCLSWVFFRTSSIDKAMEMLNQIHSRFGMESIISAITNQIGIYGLITIGFAIHWLPVSFKESYRGAFIKSTLALKVVATLLIAFIILQFKASEIQPFIYFRF
ncbi:MAG: MBOAT family protein [Bacteroidales bacterium]|nr:MAG: MBOAT family protein [Bacteroidales bacterium]